MKKLITCLVLFLFAFGIQMRAGDKYDDVKPLFEEMIKAFDKFISALDQADSAAAVAAALDDHTKAMLKMAPDIKAINKKYPELNDEDAVLPDSLKDLEKKMTELTKKLQTLFGKLSQYSSDPGVKKAMERWQKSMAALDPKEEDDEK